MKVYSGVLRTLLAGIVLGGVVCGTVGAGVKPTTPSERNRSFRQRQQMDERGLFHDLSFRCVGPVVMSGRVVDVEPSPVDPYTFYVAYATGGLWKTENNGMRFTPLMEGENVVALGDIALQQDNTDVIWVGTGEANSARSHYSGTGIYKTTDGGKSWKCMGLTDSHHIGRVIIHPKNPDVVFVAAMGHLYSENAQRGVFQTKDGGKTWKKVLYVNNRTGAIDITFDPTNPNVLYAAMWEKVRRAWNIDESGEGSGIYKSEDAGASWKLLEGFGQGKHIGRIGLAVAQSNPEVLYAILDNQEPKPDEDLFGDAKISKLKLVTMSREDVLALPDDELDGFFRRCGFQEISAKEIRVQLESEELGVGDLVDYMVRLDEGALIPAAKGAEVYRSDDGGKTWAMMNLTYLDSMYNIAGYYFGQIRVAPDDENTIYIMGVPLLTSDDAGRTYESIGTRQVHVDHHALWIDPKHPEHLIEGNDGGLNLSYDGGETWQKLNYVPVGQFYAVNFDMAEPYNIYGGLQDNGTYKGSSRSVPNESREWERVSGGDGFYIQIAEDMTTYAGSQFGHYARFDKDGGRASVRPGRPRIDEPGLRFNWQTPILLSSHSSNVLYYGANRLFRSLDRGENLKAISPVLTGPKVSGNVPYGTITTIAESRQTFGVIYVGTDDGRIHVTRDGGFTWNEIANYLPKGLWCSRLETSYYTDGLVYLSLTGYRDDDFRAYLYKSDDFGVTWESIKGNLPDESVNVIREDPLNPHVLYVGTDMGVFVSLDSGQSWEVLQRDIPISPAHDLVIHPRDRELVVGTHGRSIYVMDVELVQTLTPKVRQKAVHVFEAARVGDYNKWERKPSAVKRRWSREPDPVKIRYWSAKKIKAKITLKSKDGRVVKKWKRQSRVGINVIEWDLVVDRDAELKWHLEEVKKEHSEAIEKLEKAETETDEKDEKPNEQADAGDAEEDKVKKEDADKEEKQKREDEMKKLKKAVEDAADKVEAIQKVVDEAKEYMELPESTRDKMIRKIYIAEGDYTIEIKQGKDTDSGDLKVGGERKRREKLDTDEKRKAETKRLLAEYEIEKQQ